LKLVETIIPSGIIEQKRRFACLCLHWSTGSVRRCCFVAIELLLGEVAGYSVCFMQRVCDL